MERRTNNSITLKNEVPELLEALCDHPDCPEWLQFGIWDLVADRTEYCMWSADYWRAALRSIAEHADEQESEPAKSSNVVPFRLEAVQ